MKSPASDRPLSLVERLATLAEDQPGEGPLVELAVGRRSAVAVALADRGFAVVATDLHERSVPEPVAFVRDDLTEPTMSVYAGAQLLYARNLPAELQTPAVELATSLDAPLAFTTLGAEAPIVSVERDALSEGTLYRATGGPEGSEGPGTE